MTDPMRELARDKATVTLDRAKVQDAMDLTGGRSMSEVIDIALDRLIRAEQPRRDMEPTGPKTGPCRQVRAIRRCSAR